MSLFADHTPSQRNAPKQQKPLDKKILIKALEDAGRTPLPIDELIATIDARLKPPQPKLHYSKWNDVPEHIPAHDPFTKSETKIDVNVPARTALSVRHEKLSEIKEGIEYALRMLVDHSSPKPHYLVLGERPMLAYFSVPSHKTSKAKLAGIGINFTEIGEGAQKELLIDPCQPGFLTKLDTRLQEYHYNQKARRQSQRVEGKLKQTIEAEAHDETERTFWPKPYQNTRAPNLNA